MDEIYFDGKPCSACGSSTRYAKRQNVCVQCGKRRINEWRTANADKIAAQRQRQKMAKITRLRAMDPFIDTAPTHEQRVEEHKKQLAERQKLG